MASSPTKGDRLIAKVKTYFFTDDTCKKPVPPGFGEKNGIIVPVRLAGEEVGVYTGESKEQPDGSVNYQVDWVFQFRVVPPWPKKPYDSINKLKSWVIGSEVTGYWDKGVDSPLNDPKNQVPPPPPSGDDNTNLYLVLALGATIFLKFILPNMRR